MQSQQWIRLPNSKAKVFYSENQTDSTKIPVILTHGLFSNHRVCFRLAEYLSGHGYACYIVEWPHRQTSLKKSLVTYTFDSLAVELVPEAINHIMTIHSVAPFWIGHSGGGILPSISLARGIIDDSSLSGIVMLATQTAYAITSPYKRPLFYALEQLINLGLFSGPFLKLGPVNENSSIMRQWVRWNRSGKFVGSDGFDYETPLWKCQVPVLCLAGAGDKFIAPPEACKRFVSLFGGPDNTFQRLGVDAGFAEDYSHAGIIRSEAAKSEVWPMILDWLEQRGN